MTASTPPVLPDERLAAGAARLTVQHAGRFSAETVQRPLVGSDARPATTAHVHSHLVVLAERLTTERLDAPAHVQGAPGSGLPRVLFVCSGPSPIPTAPRSPSCAVSATKSTPTSPTCSTPCRATDLPPAPAPAQ
ncbi:hypothetical protein [Streptomyces bugieae]|uniref:Protein-tyrosine-phosphatase-like N-terminal domain-containing protein n=1 Tax=Streptomyces bugieae TaxID=3098223 RepID=A0ABU7NII3_9ACTN|nr:hypothetical protein [Streptomyces sp. DSM 41528]